VPTFVPGAANSAVDTGGGSGLSISVSVNAASGTNLGAVIDIDYFNGAISSVTGDGNAATHVVSRTNASSGAIRTSRYVITGIATGNLSYVANFVGDPFAVAAIKVRVYSDLHQATPITASAAADGDSAGPATVNVSSASGQLVVDSVFAFIDSITVGASQSVEDATMELDNWGGAFSSGASAEAGAGTVTMSWAIGSSAPWNIIASSLQAPAAGATKRNNLALMGVGR
jgi:hypothetical protein